MSQPKSQERLSLRQGIGLAIGMVVGSGLLALPGLSLEQGPFVAAVAWVLIAVAVIPLIEIFSALAVRYPTAEGLAYYARMVLGPWARQGVTWILVISSVFAFPVLAIVGGSYLTHALGLPEAAIPFMAGAILIVVSCANLTNSSVSGTVALCCSALLVCLVLAIFFSNLGYVAPGLHAAALAWTPGFPVAWPGVGRVMTLLFWAFLGWENLSSCTEQMENPRRNVPRAFYTSFFLVTLLYLALALISIGASTRGLHVARADGLAVFGHSGFWGALMDLGMAAVILSNANSWTFGYSRFLQAAGREGSIPAIFGRTTSQGAPANAVGILLATNLTMLALVSRGLFSLSDLVILVDQAFIVLYAIAIIAYYRTPASDSSAAEGKAKRTIVALLAAIPFSLLATCFNVFAVIPIACLALSAILSWRRGKRAQVRLARPSRRRLALGWRRPRLADRPPESEHSSDLLDA